MIKIDFNSAHAAACYILAHDDNEKFAKYESYEEVYELMISLCQEFKNKEIHSVGTGGLLLTIDEEGFVTCWVDPLRRFDPNEPPQAFLLVE